MIITRHGNGAFRVQTGGTTLVVDPEDSRIKADITLQTGTLLPMPEFMGEPTEIIGPGEYDIKDIKIAGYPAVAVHGDEKVLATAYEVRAEDLTLAFLGNPSKKPDIGLVEKLGDIDILFVASGAEELAKQLEPKMIVVTHANEAKAAGKDFGGKIESMEKLTIRKKDLPTSPVTVFLSA